ncbi:galactosylceramide sulfotransferase-like [Glandiceps talaboti]
MSRKRCLAITTVLWLVFFCVMTSLWLKFYRLDRGQIHTKKIIKNSGINQRLNTATSFIKQTCEPKQNFVFIKTTKTGSSSLAALLFRYGLKHDLVPAVDERLKSHILKNETSNSLLIHTYDCANFPGYNFIANHLNYNRNALEKVIKHGQYFTILRSPITRVQSAFYYFKKIHTEYKGFSNPLKEFLKRYRDGKGESGMLMNWTPEQFFNSQFNRLFDFPRHVNELTVESLFENLDRELDLVMLTEYYDESLVLLRKMMCWKYEELVYGRCKAKGVEHPPTTPEMEEIIRALSPIDIKMYDYFNKTFWQKVKQYDGNFDEDLAELRSIQYNADIRCENHPESEYCQMLTKDTVETMRMVLEKQRKWEC